jgi:hypothetical protein
MPPKRQTAQPPGAKKMARRKVRKAVAKRAVPGRPGRKRSY